MNTLEHVVVAGDTLVARLLALRLHKAGTQVTWVRTTTAKPLLNPEIWPMGGDDVLPVLVHQSIRDWRQTCETLERPGLLQTALAVDLATSVGRAAMLKQEAVLDAASGENISYTRELPVSINFERVRGMKLWPDAPLLARDVFSQLDEVIAAAGIGIVTGGISGMDVANPTKPHLTMADGTPLDASHTVITDAAMALPLLKALNLRLPLRPARGHILTMRTKKPHALPMVVHRLRRGHVFVVPEGETTVALHYNAVNDPSQATFSTKPSPDLVKALQQYIGGLLVPLKDCDLVDVATTTHWVTPDFLPALGVWPGLERILLAAGFCGRGHAFAAAASQVLTDAMTSGGNAMGLNALAPNRFAGGVWQAVHGPGSLLWQDNLTHAQDVAMADGPDPAYMDKVAMVDPPAPQYANTVNQVEKTIVGQNKTTQLATQKSGKPKIQMAPLKQAD